MKMGIWRSDFFSKRLGLIAWLREFMSRRNPSSRSASSPKVEEKVCISFSSCSTPRRGLSRSNRHLKFTSFAKDLHQVLKPEKMALGMPLTSLNAASNITHSAIASQDSSRMTTTFNAHCTGHCTVEDFNVNFANHDAKSVRYRTVRMISPAGAQRQLRTGAAVRTHIPYSPTPVRSASMYSCAGFILLPPFPWSFWPAHEPFS